MTVWSLYYSIHIIKRDCVIRYSTQTLPHHTAYAGRAMFTLWNLTRVETLPRHVASSSRCSFRLCPQRSEEARRSAPGGPSAPPAPVSVCTRPLHGPRESACPCVPPPPALGLHTYNTEHTSTDTIHSPRSTSSWTLRKKTHHLSMETNDSPKSTAHEQHRTRIDGYSPYPRSGSSWTAREKKKNRAGIEGCSLHSEDNQFFDWTRNNNKTNKQTKSTKHARWRWSMLRGLSDLGVHVKHI